MDKNLDNLTEAVTLLESARSLIIQAIAKIEGVQFDHEYCLDTLFETVSGCAVAVDQIKVQRGNHL